MSMSCFERLPPWIAAVCLLIVCSPLDAALSSAGPTPATAAPFYATTFPKTPTVPALRAAGRVLFFDAGLSASGRMACASCHDPAHAYGPPNALPVQHGGADRRLSGTRAVPSLRYLQNVPAFTEHFTDDDGDDSVDQGPAGGHTWDGRAATVHEQASIPLLSPFEMANASPAAVVERLRHSVSAPALRDTFGGSVLDDPDLAFKAALLALEVFQQSPEEFYPYDSKYDAFLRRQTRLTAQEMRGLQLFNDPRKGNCAQCHPSTIKSGAFPQFTDYGYIALGVPRNRKIPANADTAYHDLGLCGPVRTDLSTRPEYCGLFRTPSLRNTALRRTYFHNGVFHRLDEVVRFYAERDTNPERWYPRSADRRPKKSDDLPERYQDNVNVEPPFGGRVGGKPALTETEIRDVVAFLSTLNDGYRPSAGTAGIGARTRPNTRRSSALLSRTTAIEPSTSLKK